jgi:hypothetical protein
MAVFENEMMGHIKLENGGNEQIIQVSTQYLIIILN